MVKSGFDLAEADIIAAIGTLSLSAQECEVYGKALLNCFKRNPTFFMAAWYQSAPVGFFFSIPLQTNFVREWCNGSHDLIFSNLSFPEKGFVHNSTNPTTFGLLLEVIHIPKSEKISSSVVMYALMQYFADTLIEQAKLNRMVSGFYADAYNESGSQLSRLLGLEKCRQTQTGWLYRTIGMPQKMLLYTAADRPLLQQLYAKKDS